MRKTGLYIEDAGSYYRRRYGKKKWKQILGKGMLGLLLVSVLGGTIAVRGAEAAPGKDAGLETETELILLEGSPVLGSPVLSSPVLESASLEGQSLGGSVFGELQKGRNQAYVSAAETEEADGKFPKAPEDTVIVIDPGHGGMDDGCVRQKVLEKEVNLEIAEAVKIRLEELGYQVVFTREDDSTGLSLEERVEFAQREGADAYISIHQNAWETKDVNGMETWYSVQNEGENSKRLAQLVQMYAVQQTGAKDRGVMEEEELYVIRESTMPSCLIETGFLSNDKERQNLTSAEYQDKLADGIAGGIDLFFQPKTMYLTFDDGPSPENTNAVLDTLKEYHIKATFFVVGENVKKYPQVARRIVEEGHTIGIHCYSHRYEELYESSESYLKDFEAAYETVYETTGVEVKLFRFPGGSINDYNEAICQDIIEEMTERGFIYFDWNASLEDAAGNKDEAVLLANARQSTLGRKRIVMLAHDIVYPTTQCLDELIEQFPDYQFLPLTQEVAPIQF